jgi:hypothetical protein
MQPQESTLNVHWLGLSSHHLPIPPVPAQSETLTRVENGAEKGNLVVLPGESWAAEGAPSRCRREAAFVARRPSFTG